MWADNTATMTDLYNIALYEVTGSTLALTGRKEEYSYPNAACCVPASATDGFNPWLDRACAG
jgi:hypothetical protein